MDKQGVKDPTISHPTSNPTSTPSPAKTSKAKVAKQASTTSSTSTSQIVPTPSTTSSLEVEEDIVLVHDSKMEESQEKATEATPGDDVTQQHVQTVVRAQEGTGAGDKVDEREKRRKKKAALKKSEKKKAKSKKKKSKRRKDSSDDSSSSSYSSDSDSESDSETEKRRRRKKKVLKVKKIEKSRKQISSSESSSDESVSSSSSSSPSSSSDSETDVEVERKSRKKNKALKKKSRRELSSDNTSDTSSSESEDDSELERKKRKKKKKKAKQKSATENATLPTETPPPAPIAPAAPPTAASTTSTADQSEATKLQQRLAQQQLAMILSSNVPPPVPAPPPPPPEKKKKGKLEYKRLDHVWDSKLRDYKLTETVEEKKDEFDCVFAVRRRFNYENQYTQTYLDIKSKLLKEALKEILKDVKGISLEGESPSIKPNMLFLYHDEIKTFYRKTLKTKQKKEKKHKLRKRLDQQIAQCKLLSDYLSLDYAAIKKKLRPMLKAGQITYEFLWALFKPNTIAYTPTYGSVDDPRCFRVDYAMELPVSPFSDETFYSIQGRYLEYDGKIFGLGDFGESIEAFKGVRKITTLSVYPLEYHKTPVEVRTKLVERGKKFVALQGMNYRLMKGLGYQKQKRGVAKVTVNGRVMVDPALFRRIKANYPVGWVQKKSDQEQDNESDESDDDGCGCEGEEEDEKSESEKPPAPTFRLRVIKTKEGKWRLVRVPIDKDGKDASEEQLEVVQDKGGEMHEFTEEELLIASPVVLGFAFGEKDWLEFALSGIREIEWNKDAFDSLVLPSVIKQNLRGLVSSHRFDAAKTIDDVIQGKGKGLNIVLHGPPGVGKTLTAESIAEYLKAPLYAVSAGELGTSSRQLDMELQKIMEMAHCWGAILLLDEADVFLEQRAANDVHRNALVSVFLRLLEYYQGILFLTTNRVNTFDEAFQSRIHMPIRYENLPHRARKEIWQSYIGRVRDKMATLGNGKEGPEFTSQQFEELAKRNLNGRQIKNACSTAQSIALAEEGVFGVGHVKRVLEVQEDFESDLKGGSGYRDAMRHYT
ncbi:hypothetical protein EJ04DRAFT_514069 [Polyplosphaeria fusca]|uniref:AAA+ ATPase domain-containing protein n=1 Tax=Polyplosphaeria fusca TaxID=682080 RepID=A0A9P4QWJ0_9PLEO|nr:hypothetical protein EJ04DRAFT_514069 [Polyplosphaeria fusca]